MVESDNGQKNDSFVSRSKSYDAKLADGYLAEQVANERMLTNRDSMAYNNSKNELTNDSEQTKIIITSFAPIPDAARANQDTNQDLFIRPKSYQSGHYTGDSPAAESTSYNRNLSLLWPNGRSNAPIILFSPKVIRKTCWECKKIGEQYRLSFKFFHGERKLVKAILEGHGFREVHQNSSEFNLIWSGSNLKSYSFRSLQENQKVNHFPRSCELTRKDRLYKNIQRMQKEKGTKAFNIVPTTFVLPFEIDDFYNTFYKEKGIWIVKPVSLSRGRGIYLINHPDQIPLDNDLVVSRYISNPLLIDGFKFDLRLYVAVTSFDPLIFYLYEEGLTRFATIKYDQSVRNLKNSCIHLTNYSVNKKNDKYVKCTNPDVENYGNKWSISALLKYLNGRGIDTFNMMMNIEEAIIKTIVSVESPMASAARMFMPFKGNCFELFGFDILIDDSFKPWVLEVNLSPSLDCDALLDVKIKSNMIADLLTLSGVVCQNSSTFSSRSRQRERFNRADSRLKVRPHSANLGTSNQTNKQASTLSTSKTNETFYDGLSHTEQVILKTSNEENQRANGWIRLFPTSDTWEFYSQYLETRSTGYNVMLHKKLFPKRWNNGSQPKKATQTRAKMLESLYECYKNSRTYNTGETTGASLSEALERYKRYERQLKDVIKPNEDTLKKLTNMPNVQTIIQQQQQQHNIKSNLATFPNGGGSQYTNETSKYSPNSSNNNTNNNQNSSLSSAETSTTTNEDLANDRMSKSTTGFSSSNNRKYLPYINQNDPHNSGSRTNSSSQLARYHRHHHHHHQQQQQNHNHTSTSAMGQRKGALNSKMNDSSADQEDYDYGDDDDVDDEDVLGIKNDPESSLSDPEFIDSGVVARAAHGDMGHGLRQKKIDHSDLTASLPKPNGLDIKYDLGTVLMLLNDGYYVSRILVRNAFALYLFKVQLRLVYESQSKDDSNLQQMELVVRFLKKAAPNLSQEFKVYMPSKRLPINEQKRMLAKQLHDFLHIYRKDTEQLRVELNFQLENERKKHRSHLINEKEFQNLLYKLNESQLEELMSTYMKNSHDSSVFLGINKSNQPNASPAADVSNDVSLTKGATIPKPLQQMSSSPPDVDSNAKFNQSNKSTLVRPPFQFNSDESQRQIPGAARPVKLNNRQKSTVKEPKSLKKLNHEFVTEDVASLDDIQSIPSDDELDTMNGHHSIWSRSTSAGKPQNRVNDKQRLRLLDLNTSSYPYSKAKTGTTDYETIMKNIYLSSNKKKKLNKLNKNHNYDSHAKTALLPLNTGKEGGKNGTDFEKESTEKLYQRSLATSLGILKADSNLSKTLSSDPGLEQKQTQLANCLKNLTIKQQERVYSAARSSFRLTSSFNLLSESSPNNNNNNNNYNISSPNGTGKSNTNKQNDTTTASLTNYGNNDANSKNILLEKLQKQKEKTNMLLEKSKAKHNEMILSPLFQTN